MKVASLVRFLRFKKLSSETIFCDSETGDEVLDVFGRPIECSGKWIANKKMDHFSTAISCLHKAHGLTCDYQDICYLCKQADSGEGVAVGCRHHRTRPRLVRCGMPNKAEESVNNRDALKNPNNMERGCDS